MLGISYLEQMLHIVFVRTNLVQNTFYKWGIIVLSSLLLLTTFFPGHVESAASDDIDKQCTNCRHLVEQFIKEFKATDRGLYEGGDTDWELKNMKEYKKSEVRLIEITENLFKTKKDAMTRILEEVEEVLENFWTDHWDHIDDESNELDRFLCVSHLKTCCEHGYYGPQCDRCDVGESGNCSGYGKCNGNGTRSGTGACECEDGFRGSFCEECKKGYKRKDETDDKSECVDIDECNNAENHTPCEDGKYCSNKPGYYSCKKCHDACDNGTCTGQDPSDCTGDTCAEGFQLIKSLPGKGCEEVPALGEQGLIAAAVKILVSLWNNIPMEVFTIGGYVMLVSLGALVLSRYNKMVACTMVTISLLFGVRHYTMFITTHYKV